MTTETFRARFSPDAFRTSELAWQAAAAASDRLADVGIRVESVRHGGLPTVFVVAAAARGQGLAIALDREGRINRHATLPLLRALLDTLIVSMEVRRHPRYADVLFHKPPDWPPDVRPLSSQRLLARAEQEIPGSELSEIWLVLTGATHFGFHGVALAIEETIAVGDGTTSFALSSDLEWQNTEMDTAIARHTADLLDLLEQTLTRILDEDFTTMGEG